MKFVIDCEVESQVILTRRIEIRSEGREFHFEIDERGIWNRVKAIAKIENHTSFRWGTVPTPEPRLDGHFPFTVIAEPDPSLVQELTAALQRLESTLSVFVPVSAINWKTPTWTVIVEADDSEERKKSGLNSFKVSRPKPGPIAVNELAMVEFIGLAAKSQELVIVESFWRDAENQYCGGHYINAVFGFYFIWEGLFGNGKWKNKEVKQEFKQSKEIVDSLNEFMSATHPQKWVTTLAELIPWCKTRIPTVNDWISLIVDKRGYLHHFSNKPGDFQGSPLVHDRYEGLASLMRYVAHKALVKRALSIAPEFYKSV